MNFLQISYGPQIERRMGFVKTVLQQLQEGDTYTLIADQNRVKDDRVIWIPAAEYEQMLMDKYEPIRRFWENSQLRDGKIKFADRSDIIRVHYASEHPDLLYCDTDIKFFDSQQPDRIEKQSNFYVFSSLRSILTVYDMEKLPCYGARSVSSYLIDGVFYNGSRTDFFSSFFNWILKQEQRRKRQQFGWYARYIRQVAKTKVTGFFKHCGT